MPDDKKEIDLMGSRSVTPYLIAGAVGGGLWLATSYLADRREAWAGMFAPRLYRITRATYREFVY